MSQSASPLPHVREVDILLEREREGPELGRVHHVAEAIGRDAPVGEGARVVRERLGAHGRGIEGLLAHAGLVSHEALGHGHATERAEEVGHGLDLVRGLGEVGLDVGETDEARGRGEVPGKAERAGAHAVRREVEAENLCGLGLLGRERKVVAQVLDVPVVVGRVGEHADRVAVDGEPAGVRLDHHGLAAPVGEEEVHGHLVARDHLLGGEVVPREERDRLVEVGAGGERQRDGEGRVHRGGRGVGVVGREARVEEGAPAEAALVDAVVEDGGGRLPHGAHAEAGVARSEAVLAGGVLHEGDVEPAGDERDGGALRRGEVVVARPEVLSVGAREGHPAAAEPVEAKHASLLSDVATDGFSVAGGADAGQGGRLQINLGPWQISLDVDSRGNRTHSPSHLLAYGERMRPCLFDSL